MTLQENISLQPYNTFGIEVRARHFIEINSVDDLRQALFLKDFPQRFILSGGSNILLTRDIEKLVLYINIKGVRVLWEDEKTAVIKVMAGENWHNLVIWCLDRDLGGLENLSLIPGNVGTAPIQNIGAYGVELKDVFESCEAMEISTGKIRKFEKADCRFGYRDSYFKNHGKGEFIITSVNFRLTKSEHKINTSYGAIENQLKAAGISAPTIKDVSNAVIHIRQSKLPDPAKLGNSGSFFKNPVLDESQYRRFKENFPNSPSYDQGDGTFKVPAGWLIENCGFKGKRIGDAGVHKDQALVLVNYGKARGEEILSLARTIQQEVLANFGIELTPEVNIIE